MTGRLTNGPEETFDRHREFVESVDEFYAEDEND